MKAQTNTDFYKVDHRSQYEEGTSVVFANWTARKSRLSGVDKVVFFGLQAYSIGTLYLKWYDDFFSRPKAQVVNHYKEIMSGAGFSITYDHIAKLHDLGYLPLEIWALPEGTAVPIGVPMFVMWNTLPEFFWLTNYIETSMSANIWGPCTSATIAKEYRKILEHFASLTGGDLEEIGYNFVDIQGHDFSYRGMYGDYAAALSGAGHLLSFKGTDTVPAIEFLKRYYNGVDIGGSIPATEHSVMSMGTKEKELETYRRLITEVYPSGPMAIVSDTWDYWKVWTEILPALKNEIMNRDGKLVIRPDSGDPADIICGNPRAEIDSPAYKGSVELAWNLFGGTVTEKGYKKLDPHIGLIYGDSITLDVARDIGKRLTAKGFVPNVVLGIGSYTYQMVTRDTFGFALKTTAGIVNGELRELFKDPVTDDGTKKSAKGLTAVDENLKLKQVKTFDEVRNCAFKLVYLNGVVGGRTTLSEIRERIKGA